MKIPRKLEWKVGVLLFGTTLILMFMVIGLATIRVNVGLELEGLLHRRGPDWILEADIPDMRLSLLRECHYADITYDEQEVLRAIIAQINGRIDYEPDATRVWITLKGEVDFDRLAYNLEGTVVQAKLVERERVALAKILFDSILQKRQDNG